jgi:NTE family protein
MSDPAQVTVEDNAPIASKQALVLSGGNVKGAYQAGAIAEILQCEHFRPSAIYGISVGSINGGMLASYLGEQFLDPEQKATAPNFAAAGLRVEEFWKNNIHRFKDIAAKKRIWRIAWEVLRHDFRGILNVDASINIIRKEINPKHVQEAANRGIEFFPGTLNLTTGDYFDGSPDSKPPIDYTNICDYVIASSMAPLVMPLWAIPSDAHKGKSAVKRWREDRKERREAKKKPDHADRDDSWLDGGIYYPAPISSAIEDGYDDIICVLTRPTTIGRGSFRGRLERIGERISDVVAQKLLDVDEKWADDMQAWIEFLETKVKLSKAEFAEFKKTPFGNYRSFQLKPIRPDKELPYKIETLEDGQVEEMAKWGRDDARVVMRDYRRHVPKPYAKASADPVDPPAAPAYPNYSSHPAEARADD